MSVFINLSNHPSSQWSHEQLRAALALGEIIDIPFPQIDPTWSTEEIDNLASKIFNDIRSLGDPVVLVQGEYAFAYRIIKRLHDAGIRAVTCCSQRLTEEFVNEVGHTVKNTVFKFNGFRDYFLPND